MSKPKPPTYRTTNWRAYNAGLRQRGSLQIWFDPEMVWQAEPSGKRGRPATFTDGAIQACLTLKALFGPALRQTTGRVASLLKLAGLDWPVPDFSPLSRRQKGLNVAIPSPPGPSRPSPARHGPAPPGPAPPGTARHGAARPGTARHGPARVRCTCRSTASR